MFALHCIIRVVAYPISRDTCFVLARISLYGQPREWAPLIRNVDGCVSCSERDKEVARLLLLYVPVTDSPLDIEEILPKFDEAARSEEVHNVVLVEMQFPHCAPKRNSSFTSLFFGCRLSQICSCCIQCARIPSGCLPTYKWNPVTRWLASVNVVFLVVTTARTKSLCRVKTFQSFPVKSRAVIVAQCFCFETR